MPEEEIKVLSVSSLILPGVGVYVCVYVCVYAHTHTPHTLDTQNNIKQSE